MFYLAWRNVTRRLGQSVVTALIVCIAVFVVTATCAATASIQNSIKLSEERLGADIMVLPAAASVNASEVLFTAQPVNVYLPASSVDAVAGVEGVAQASPQFFTQTVNESCCSVVGVTRVVGIDASSDFTVSPWVSGGAALDLAADDILVGSVAPPIEGGQASILGSVFHVAGTLEPTGTSVDETIFMDINAARTIAAASPYLTSIWGDADPFDAVSCVMVKVADGADVEAVAAALVEACPGAVAVPTSDMVAGMADQLSAITSIGAVLLVLLIVVAALALAGRISALVASRKKELGLMRTMGAGLGSVTGYLVCETGIVTLAGSIVGIVAGCVAASTCVSVLHSTFNLPGAAPTAASFALAAAAGLAFAVLLNAVCLVQPYASLRRTDPQEALARGDM